MPALVVILVLLIGGLAAWFSYQARKKRRDALAAFATKHGLRYSADDPFDIDGTMPHRLFSMGDGRGCENVVWGTWDSVPMTEFDYWYYVTSTDSEGHSSRTYHRFSCVMTQISASCPDLIATPENMMTRLADTLGFHDIDFESEEFNRAWQIKCKDRKFANDLIDQRMMQWMMQVARGWSFEVAGPLVLIYCGKMRAERVQAMFEIATEFYERVPRVLSSLYPSSSAPAPGAPGA